MGELMGLTIILLAAWKIADIIMFLIKVKPIREMLFRPNEIKKGKSSEESSE